MRNTKFEFEGVTYVAQKYDSSCSGDQCDACDLAAGGRKRCLNSRCDCGDCGKYTGFDKIVYKAKNLSADDRAMLREQGLRKQIERLTNENEYLEELLKKTTQKVFEKEAEIGRFKEQLNHIYGKINVAIKREIYKNF